MTEFGKFAGFVLAAPFMVVGKTSRALVEFISPPPIKPKWQWTNVSGYEEAMYSLETRLKVQERIHREETEKLQKHIRQLEQERRGRQLQ